MKDKNTYIINGKEYTEWEPTLSWRDIPKILLGCVGFGAALAVGIALIYFFML